MIICHFRATTLSPLHLIVNFPVLSFILAVLLLRYNFKCSCLSIQEIFKLCRGSCAYCENVDFTRSSAIAERPARRYVSAEMLFYGCTNNANTSPVSQRSTFSNCHILFRYLHSFVHASFNYRTASMGTGTIYNQPC